MTGRLSLLLRLLTSSLLLSVVAGAPVLFTVASGSSDSALLLSSLDSVLKLASNYPCVALTLLKSDVAFEVSLPVKISNEVSIEGANQTVIVRSQMVILESSLLHMSNARLISSEISSDFQAIFQVRGRVVIENCSLEELSRPGFEVSGEMELINTNVTRSSEVLISLKSIGRARMNRVLVMEHIGTFLSIEQKSVSGPIAINISDSTFRSNFARTDEPLFSISGSKHGGTFTVTSSRFLSNLSPLFYFDITKFTVVIDGCEFIANDQTVMTVYAKDTQMTIHDCTAAKNSEIFIDVRSLQGDVMIENTDISEQRRKGPIRVVNSLSSDKCHFSVRNSSISNIKLSVNVGTPGAVLVISCLAQIVNVRIKEVRISTIKFNDLRSLIYSERGQIRIENLSLDNSGSSGAVLASVLGEFSISDSVLTNPLSDTNAYFVMTMGRFALRNVTVIDGNRLNPSHQSISSNKAIYIVIAGTIANVQNFSAIQANSSQIQEGIFGITDSQYAISNIDLESISLKSIAGIIASTGSFSNMTIHKCHVYQFFFIVLIHSQITVHNLTIEDSISVNFHRGVFVLARNCSLYVWDFNLTGVEAEMLVTARMSVVRLERVWIARSTFEYLVHYPIQAVITIENLNYTQSIGGVALGVESEIIISESYISEIAAKRCIFDGESSNITLRKVTIRDVTSKWLFGKLHDGSQFTISDSFIDHISSEIGEGLLITDSNLTIIQSEISAFHLSLIQARSSSITLINSLFRDGRNPTQTLKSDLAYGGVLGCVDCTAVLIVRVTVFNVTARAGGGIAVRTRNALKNCNLQVRFSSFLYCRSYIGGAIAILNSQFQIDSTAFISNSAEMTGGAIDVSIPASLRGLISNCSFERNSALEGGAIKWKNAEIGLKQLTFTENNATYGRNVASYGVKISSNLSDSNIKAVSGGPFALIFELLDHYGQRVTTASNKAFRLIPIPTVSFRGNEVLISSYGVFNFSELTIYAPPNSSQVISGVMNDTQGDVQLTLEGSAIVSFRECRIGEIWKSDRCEYCYPGNVSYSIYDEDCHFCPSHGVCPGGWALLVDPHYWRRAWDSLTLLRCPLADKCLGGSSSMCADGYTGPLCNQCAEQYYRFRSVECERCGNIAAIWVQMLTVLLLIGAFVFFVLKYAVKTLNPAKLFAIKSIVHHAQFLSAISPLKVSFSDIIRGVLHGVTYVSSLLISDLPIACLNQSTPEYVRAILGSLLLPALVLISAIACRLFTKSWKANTIILTTSSMLFTPIVAVNVLIPLLACQKVDSGVEWLFLDMSQQCWTDSHLRMLYYFLVPSLAINVSMPLGVTALIACKHPSLFDRYFPLWACGYKWRCWDMLFTVAKATCFALLFASLTYDTLSQLTYGLVVMIITCIINVSVCEKAFVNDKYFYLSEAALIIATVSMGLGGVYIYYYPSGGASDYFVGVLFLLMNLGVFAIAPCLKFHAASSEHNRAENYRFSQSSGNLVRVSVPNNTFIDPLHVIAY